jgi:hypothetical protein
VTWTNARRPRPWQSVPRWRGVCCRCGPLWVNENMQGYITRKHDWIIVLVVLMKETVGIKLRQVGVKNPSSLLMTESVPILSGNSEPTVWRHMAP